MTYKLTLRATPDGIVVFFEEEMREQYESQIQRLRTKCLQTKKCKSFLIHNYGKTQETRY